VAENDSQGELIHLIAQYYRYTGDRAWLQRMWPYAASAIAYMNSLRATERTARNQSGGVCLYGLMPASISHEGYSDRPAYSYWDDFWALAGYNGAVEIARALGRADDLGQLIAQREEFRNDLLASVRASIAQHGIDYIPGSADRGDFDATATTIALSVSGQQADLPRHELEETFERYWRNFLTRRDGGTNWNDYTPYELRTVGSFVRLGGARAHNNSILPGRPPSTSWNQWAGGGRDARQPRFLGDKPTPGLDLISSTPLDLLPRARVGLSFGWLLACPAIGCWSGHQGSIICALPGN
jgi:hypothetical protein